MARSGIKIELSGFEEILRKIDKAGGDSKKAVGTAINRSITVYHESLKKHLRAATKNYKNLEADIKVSNVTWSGDECSAEVGWQLGDYDPKNLSEGYKAVFLNYGTPRRQPTQIKGRKFIASAKKSVKKEVKTLYEKTFDEILRGLK